MMVKKWKFFTVCCSSTVLFEFSDTKLSIFGYIFFVDWHEALNGLLDSQPQSSNLKHFGYFSKCQQ